MTSWEVTDGFNFFMLNKAWKKKEENIILRLGGGFVIAHPDVTIDGENNRGQGNGAITFGTGYHLAGFVVQASAQKIFEINKKWYWGTEAKISYAKAYINVPGGGVFVQNRAVHLDFGLGYRF
jgi:hypothetical protein